MSAFYRKLHKYFSLLVSVQLLLWTISGIYFSFNKIENVRGEYLLKEVKPFNETIIKPVSFNDAKKITLVKRLDQSIFAVVKQDNTYYYNKDGSPTQKISFELAKEIVLSKTFLKPLSIVEITKETEGAEYRGRPLPLYKIDSSTKENERLNIYMQPFSGEILAIRSNQWRIWDLMWGLHIMDWQERDNIGNIFLKIFSLFALVSALSGIFLFYKTSRKGSF
jgi:hypothetical protein